MGIGDFVQGGLDAIFVVGDGDILPHFGEVEISSVPATGKNRQVSG